MARQVDKGEIKAKIAQQAFAVFIETGLEAFSLSDFLKQIKVPKGKFYYYFRSKDELLFEAVQTTLLESFSQFETSVNWSDGLADKLMTAYDFFLVEMPQEQHRKRWMFVHDIVYLYVHSDEPRIKQFMRYQSKVTQKILARIFEDEIKKGRIRTDAKAFIYTLEATVLGLIQQALFLPEFDFHGTLKHYFKLLETYAGTHSNSAREQGV